MGLIYSNNFFFELHTYFYENILSWRMKYILSLCIFTISHHDTLLSFWIQIFSLLWRNSSACPWAKNPEMWNIWLVTKPSLIWSFSIYWFLKIHILNLCRTFNGFITYIRIQTLSFNHTGCHLLKHHVLPLCHAILLWCVGD